jgi:integrase
LTFCQWDGFETVFLDKSSGLEYVEGVETQNLKMEAPTMAVRNRTKSPYWHYDFWYRGRRYKGSTKQTSKVRAQEYESRLRWQIEHGEDPFIKSPLLDDLRTKYLAWLETNRSPKHVTRSRQAIDNVLGGMRGVRAAEDVTTGKIENYKKRRLREVSPFTVNLELRHFKGFLRRCVKQGWLATMPAVIEGVRTPGRGRVIFLRENEIVQVLDNLRPWSRQAAEFYLQTGLRLSEGRFLEWQDVDLDAGELWVRNKPALGFTPKAGKERTVPLPPELLEQLRARQQKAGWVLEAQSGGQLDAKIFYLALKRAGKAAGLQDSIGPHTLRHTYGSRLAMAGVPLPTIKELMGHSDISTTMIYVHLTADHKRQAVAGLHLPQREEPESKVIPIRG